MRIVSLSPATTETLSILGLEDSIVGVTPWCRMYLKDRDKTIAGTYLNIDTAALRKLNPDVVFLQAHVHDKFLGVLREAGFNSYLVPLPSNLLDIISNIYLISTVVKRYWEGRELADALIEKLYSYIRSRSSIGEGARVYVEFLWPDKTFSSTGALTYIDDGVRVAGGRNIFYDRVAKFFFPNDEEITALDPQIVLVNIEPPFTGITLNQYLEIRKALRYTSAYRDNRIYLLEESQEVNLAHPGPSFITNTMKKLIEIIQYSQL
ncbi:MAG: helical backbone metal receptor [Ignisphaera sp.]|uniref:Fe/B12 periplasmic-binding domain-containing protein n=1 Tax=Ignisphaera aggregans TaxID=334771 RepID=A0A7J3JQ93_9CREN